MKTIANRPGILKALISGLSALSISAALILGLAVGATLAENTAKAEKSVEKTGTKVESTAKASSESKSPKPEEFWNSILKNRKLAWVPTDLRIPIDMIETPNSILLNAEVPGLDENSLEVSVSKDSVILKGEKKVDITQKPEDFRRLERAYGSFDKTVMLPATVDSDKATAVIRSGVLTVTMPKLAEAQGAVKKLTIIRE
ncbi:MAG TPA: Hsp20/alpha crystallin family protein [Candidatus Obscuribacterales bacterium]